MLTLQNSVMSHAPWLPKVWYYGVHSVSRSGIEAGWECLWPQPLLSSDIDRLGLGLTLLSRHFTLDKADMSKSNITTLNTYNWEGTWVGFNSNNGHQTNMCLREFRLHVQYILTIFLIFSFFLISIVKMIGRTYTITSWTRESSLW